MSTRQIQKVAGRYKSPPNRFYGEVANTPGRKGSLIISGVDGVNTKREMETSCPAPWPPQWAAVLGCCPDNPPPPRPPTTTSWNWSRCDSWQFYSENSQLYCSSWAFVWKEVSRGDVAVCERCSSEETHHHIASHMLTFCVHFVIFLLQLESLEVPLLIFWAEFIEFHRHVEDCSTKPSGYGKQSITLVHFQSIFQALSACVQLLANWANPLWGFHIKESATLTQSFSLNQALPTPGFQA